MLSFEEASFLFLLKMIITTSFKKKVEGDLRKMIVNRELINMIETENKSRGISEVKKKNCLLSKSMPASRRSFYEALEESDAPDLDTNIDSDLLHTAWIHCPGIMSLEFQTRIKHFKVFCLV